MKVSIMRKKISACLSVLAAVPLSLLSCQKAEGPAIVGDGAARLTFTATLGRSTVSGTRADDDLSRDDHYDKWSYRHFQINDNLGFFASHGDLDIANGEGPIINWPLVCTNAQDNTYRFDSDELFSFTHLDTKEIFLYYPYHEDIAKGNGMELRRKSKLEGETTEVERCVDFLVGKGIEASLNEKSMLLSGTMAHAFSELIIVRGKGFDDPPQGCEAITVVMQQPYSHIRINCSSTDEQWSCKPELVYDSTLDREACLRWEAWQGTNFGITEQNPEGVQAWYALLPTLAGNRSAVAYIEIYDNEGELRKVSSLKLADNGKTKYLEPGWQYPMQISIEELVPTVNPYPIIPWNKDGEDTDLTNERKRGIHNLVDFEFWQDQYALYLKGSGKQEELLKYGDLITDADGKNQWHFYILSDLDFTEYPYNEGAVAVIPELRDILDGVSTTLDNHTFLNHTLKGLKRPLVGNLSGSLLNMDLIQPDIALDRMTGPVGVLANTMTNATVDNCSVDNGTVRSAGPVGMAAGSISGGSVKNSSFSGFMVGRQSHAPDGDASIRYLFGEAPANTPALNGNFSEVQFSPLNN